MVAQKEYQKKNIIKINNHPLISYSIAAAKNSKYIDKIIVSSDSKEIINTSLKYGIDGFINRPKNLSTDKTTSVDALFHSVIAAEKLFDTKFSFSL